MERKVILQPIAFSVLINPASILLSHIVDGAVKISVPSIPNADGASHSDDDIDDILPLESIDDGV